MAAIDRAVIDHKHACRVVLAMRLDITKNIICPIDDAATTASYDNTDDLEFRMYEGMFDDFHYDIGHGKGTGEGTVDAARVSDGYSGRAPRNGPVGDYETDHGAKTRTWEGSLHYERAAGY